MLWVGFKAKWWILIVRHDLKLCKHNFLLENLDKNKNDPDYEKIFINVNESNGKNILIEFLGLAEILYHSQRIGYGEGDCWLLFLSISDRYIPIDGYKGSVAYFS